jgi:hypothetical protein
MVIERNEIETLKQELIDDAQRRGDDISNTQVFTDILEHLARVNGLPFTPLSEGFPYMIPDDSDSQVQALAEELRQKWS